MRGLLIFLPILLLIFITDHVKGESLSEVKSSFSLDHHPEKAEISIERDVREPGKRTKKEKKKSPKNKKKRVNKKSRRVSRKKGDKKGKKAGTNGRKKRLKKTKKKRRNKDAKKKRRRHRNKKNVKNGSGKKNRRRKKKVTNESGKKKRRHRRKKKISEGKSAGKKSKDKTKRRKKKTEEKKEEKLKKKRRRQRKLKAKRRKSQGRQTNPPAGGDWSSCGTSGVNDTCLKNAVDAMAFEKNQIQNFFKRKIRLQNHNKTTGNKLGKKGNFNTSAQHMLKALGGDINNVTCGESGSSTRSANKALDNYKTLINCSQSVMAACTPPKGQINKTKLDNCANIYNLSRTATTDCRTNTAYVTDGSKACNCWEKAAIGITIAKAEGCNKMGEQTAKEVKNTKKACIAAFSVCKKAEDAAISLIHTCMTGEVNTTNSARAGRSQYANLYQ